MDVVEDGSRCRDNVKVEIVEQRLCIEPGGSTGNVIGAIGEMQRVSLDPVAQRVRGEAVDGQQHSPGTRAGASAPNCSNALIHAAACPSRPAMAANSRSMNVAPPTHNAPVLDN